MDILAIQLLRFGERSLAILAGCFLAYLGYRLFTLLPLQHESSGKLTLPGGTAVHLTRVGPGVFFSLFGAAILLQSFMSPVTYTKTATREVRDGMQLAVTESQHYTGAAGSNSVAVDPGELRRQRNLVRGDIRLINELDPKLDPSLDVETRHDVRLLLDRTKLRLMMSVWADDEWGSSDKFEDWTNMRLSDEPPPTEDLKRAYAFFVSGRSEK